VRLRAATRASPLALWQTRHVAALLEGHGVELEIVEVSTDGDRRQDVPIHAMGGKGVFAKEVQLALLDGRADVAVHSMKDLPSVGADGLVVAAVPPRGDVRDALVGCALADLARGASVATGSVRRRAQLAHLRPDLCFHELRGNIGTRLGKASGFDAIVVAAAALERLGYHSDIVDPLAVEVLLPQAGQGALAIEARADDADTIEVLRLIEDHIARREVDAERAFLAELGGDCDLPAASHAVVEGPNVRLRSMLAAFDGTVVLNDDRTGVDGRVLGVEAARSLLDRGGRDLLGR
jgi:hydroxymethylbilane synthase